MSVKKNRGRNGGGNGKPSILIHFVLDRSGSMEVVRAATIAGFNEFKADQSKAEGEAAFSLTMFDTGFEHVCDAVPIREVTDLTMATYHPDGCTALYDAIGHCIGLADEHVAKAEVKPDQVLFVIMTDGQENSSREFDQRSIFQMIDDRHDKAGYEFIYLGANQDSYATGAAIGVRAGHMMDFEANPQAMYATMRTVSTNLRGYRARGDRHSAQWFTSDLEAEGNRSRENDAKE